MQVRIELLEDAFWGSGESIPGAEDSSILMDEHGFPYLRGTTFRGVLREEMENYFAWTGQENADSETEALRLAVAECVRKMEENSMSVISTCQRQCGKGFREHRTKFVMP